MIVDRYGGQHANVRPDALMHYERAVRAVVTHCAGAQGELETALALSPDFAAAHALRGFANVLLARRETLIVAVQSLQAMDACVDLHALAPGGQALRDALQLAAGGFFLGAAARLEAHIEDAPRDLLAIKLAHSLCFLGGDRDGMARVTTRVLPHWHERDAGYGFVQGCHAFALEEAGKFEEAEKAAQIAMFHEPHDVWGMHALAHVYEMSGRSREGVIWIESGRDVWNACNNFSYHVAWHLALFNLELGRVERALAVYDADVRPVSTDDFRDIANAASFLWRLKQENISVGDRLDELHELACRRSADVSLIFASLHHLLSLLGKGDEQAACDLIAHLANAKGEQAGVARDVGIPLAEAILCGWRGDRGASDHAVLAQKLQLLGGSHAQRDVFLRTLAQGAVNAGDITSARRVLATRSELHEPDRFAKRLKAQLLFAATGQMFDPPAAQLSRVL